MKEVIKYTIEVVTHIEPKGCLYNGLSFYDEEGKQVFFLPKTKKELGVELNMKAFEVGEILILDENGREFGGLGRKPSKWFLETKECKTIEQAIKLSKKIYQKHIVEIVASAGDLSDVRYV